MHTEQRVVEDAIPTPSALSDYLRGQRGYGREPFLTRIDHPGRPGCFRVTWLDGENGVPASAGAPMIWVFTFTADGAFMMVDIYDPDRPEPDAPPPAATAD